VKQWKQRRAAWSGSLILKETMPTHEGVPRMLGDDSTTSGDSDNDRQHGQCTKHVRAPSGREKTDWQVGQGEIFKFKTKAKYAVF
jgi:hypothetical protein